MCKLVPPGTQPQTKTQSTAPSWDCLQFNTNIWHDEEEELLYSKQISEVLGHLSGAFRCLILGLQVWFCSLQPFLQELQVSCS